MESGGGDRTRTAVIAVKTVKNGDAAAGMSPAPQ